MLELLINLANSYNNFVDNLNNFDLIFDRLNIDLNNLDQFTNNRIDTISVEQDNNRLTKDSSTFIIDYNNKIKIIKVTSTNPLDNNEIIKRLYLDKLKNVHMSRSKLKLELNNMRIIQNRFTENNNQSCATNFCTTNFENSLIKFNQIESKILSSVTSKHKNVFSGNIPPRLGR